jgi:hypothetical protein
MYQLQRSMRTVERHTTSFQSKPKSGRLNLKQFNDESTMSINCFLESFEIFITELFFNAMTNV